MIKATVPRGIPVGFAQRSRIRLFWLVRELRGLAPELSAARRLVEDGDTVVDVGAHHGYYTGYLARLVGRQGHVHAFEANPDNAGQLGGVARAHGNVTVHSVALSSELARLCCTYRLSRGRSSMHWLGSGLLHCRRRLRRGRSSCPWHVWMTWSPRRPGFRSSNAMLRVTNSWCFKGRSRRSSAAAQAC